MNLLEILPFVVTRPDPFVELKRDSTVTDMLRRTNNDGAECRHPSQFVLRRRCREVRQEPSESSGMVYRLGGSTEHTLPLVLSQLQAEMACSLIWSSLRA